MLSDQTFNYLSNDTEYRSSEIVVNHKAVNHFAKVASTGNNMTIIIEDAAWDVLPTEGAEIAAFDEVGNLIGSTVYNSPVTVLTVWGDDATTEPKDGLALTENVQFKVWSNNSINTFEASNIGSCTSLFRWLAELEHDWLTYDGMPWTCALGSSS